jgi:TetR/AcrR family transcriptional repressor of nem operon
MARPREFDEATVLEAAMNCFWAQGFEQTSVRDLAERMGITGASLYNAFGDKRSLYRRAADVRRGWPDPESSTRRLCWKQR